MDTTFATRTAALKEAALKLKECAETVMFEAQRMEAAQIRFTERVGERRSFCRRPRYSEPLAEND